MKKTKIKTNIPQLSLEEAIENLGTIADMPLDAKTPVGIIQSRIITTDDEDVPYKEIEWLFPEDSESFIEQITPSYAILLDHLKTLYENENTNWNDNQVKKSVKAVMELSIDAASKLKSYFAIFNKEVDFTKTDIFKQLQSYYAQNILKKYGEELEGKSLWESQWQKNKTGKDLDFDGSGLKDFQTVLSDDEYELFYIKNSDGEPFISPELIQNAKLYDYFEESLNSSDDLLWQIKSLQNKDTHLSSKQILNKLDKDIHEFYEKGFDWKSNELANCLNKSFMALMLASDGKNFTRKGRKSAYRYFKDFLFFFRNSFKTDEYQKNFSIKKSGKNEKTYFLVNLVNKVSLAFFKRLGGVKQEMIGFIHRLMKKDAEKESSSFWNLLMEKDDNLRSSLSKYPNFPMMELVQALGNKDENSVFDPIMQGNFPEKLFEITYDKNVVDVLYLPSPTSQEIITKADLNAEFLGFLREFSQNKKNLLLFNFQDTNSWRENARGKKIEELQRLAEFHDVVTVVSLPKNSDFYNQTEHFLFLAPFDKFLLKLKEEIFGVNSGFFIPEKIQEEFSLDKFVEDICLFIHKNLYKGKPDLSAEERKVFIELFYHFFILKIIEIVKPESMSFVCKDGLDVSSSAAGSFYSFIKILNGSKWTFEEKDFVLWLFYAPALLVKQRAVSQGRLIRQISCLAFLDENKKNLKINKFYKKNFFAK